MVEVVNRQRITKVPDRDWSALGSDILKRIGHEQKPATIAFVSDARIRILNKRFRGIDKPTDVLSFPAGAEGEYLGDIAISVERAKVQARRNELTFEREIAQLILHGLLHLCGYDHEADNGEMNRLELKLRQSLRI